RTLPISLDVGTDNQSLLDDPLYLGWRNNRLRGSEYEALVDEFVTAARNVFPEVVIQWEDFRKDNALRIMDRYREKLPSFNDDIQGTGAVARGGRERNLGLYRMHVYSKNQTGMHMQIQKGGGFHHYQAEKMGNPLELACVLAACKITGDALEESRILIYGAGAAGLGIARQLHRQLRHEGLDGDELRRAILVMDSKGVISDGREELEEYKNELAWPEQLVQTLNLSDEHRRRLHKVVQSYKPTVLIGASGQGGAFDEAAVRAMDNNVCTPIILPMSNPTSISEAEPEQILRWTEGRALVATGSPFEDVKMRGGPRRIGQANNVFIFPGVGLGAIVSGASQVTDHMIAAAAVALADSLTSAELSGGCLMPEVARLWDVCGEVGFAVGNQAMADGVAAPVSADELQHRIDAYRWRPEYPEIVEA
ncbi:MAG: malic enzyme-like NAD(P)-binding protein, partial [Woeseiaceae bacterium]